MENIFNRLKIVEIKQEKLGKSFDQIKALGSSLPQFTLHWKDVQSHLASARNFLLKHAQEIDLKEKNVLKMSDLVDERSKEVEIKSKRVEECWNEVSVKEEELKVLEASRLGCDLELCSKRKELTLVRDDVADCREKLRLVKEQLGLAQKELQEFKEDIAVKDSELKSVLFSIKECSKELNILNEQKTSVQASIRECSEELESKERSLASAKQTLKECSEELDVRKQQLTEVSGELEFKEREFSPYSREGVLLRFAEAVIQQKQAPEICRGLGFASMIPDLIKYLIAKKKHIAATRFSCEFGLVDKFPPLQLFKDYLENAIMDAYVSESSSESCEAKCKVIDKEIAALRSILECIADYKLKCSSHVVKFTNRIFELVKQKPEKRCSLQTSNPADESPQESINYHSLAASVTRGRSTQQKRLNFQDQLQGKNGNKRRRVDRASDKPSFS